MCIFELSILNTTPDNMKIHEMKLVFVPKNTAPDWKYIVPENYHDYVRAYVYNAINRSHGKDNDMRDFCITPIYNGLKKQKDGKGYYFETTENGFCVNVRSIHPIEFKDESRLLVIKDIDGSGYVYQLGYSQLVDEYQPRKYWDIHTGLCLRNPNTGMYLGDYDVNSFDMHHQINRILKLKCEKFHIPYEPVRVEFLTGRDQNIKTFTKKSKGEKHFLISGRVKIEANEEMLKTIYALGLGKLTTGSFGVITK